MTYFIEHTIYSPTV